MDAQLKSKIDEVVEEFKIELYQKASLWRQIRTSSELFDFEQKLQATFNRLQSKIVGAVIETIHQDNTFVKECKQQALLQRHSYSEGWRNAYIKTLGGRQQAIKTLYSEIRKNADSTSSQEKTRREGSGIFPVFRRLGIIRHTTPRCLAEMARQVTDGPSGAEAQERLASREIVGTQNPLWLHVRDLACIALWQRQKDLDNVNTLHSPECSILKGKRVVVGIDGGRIRIRIDKKRDEQTQKKGFTTDKCEAKLFVIYIIHSKGKKIEKEHITYDGTILSVDSIFALLKLRLIQLGIAQAQLLVIIGDGAPWIWKGASELQSALKLEGLPIYEIVDWAHAVGKLTKPAKIGVKEGTRPQTWFRQMRKFLKDGHVETVIEELQELDTSQDKDHDIRKAIEYFQTHRTRMQYAEFKAKGLPIGSGVIESAVRRIVNLRLKGACLFWHPETAEEILYLRCQIKSGNWSTFVKSVLSEWAADMSLSLVQAQQIRKYIMMRFLESHPPMETTNSCRDVVQWARTTLKDGKCLILDTETTGLDADDEIIQLAVIDLKGNVLLETFIGSG